MNPMPDLNPHPWYGECDALGPGGCCAECYKLGPQTDDMNDRISADLEEDEWESFDENSVRQELGAAHSAAGVLSAQLSQVQNRISRLEAEIKRRRRPPTGLIPRSRGG